MVYFTNYLFVQNKFAYLLLYYAPHSHTI